MYCGSIFEKKTLIILCKYFIWKKEDANMNRHELSIYLVLINVIKFRLYCNSS